MADRYGNGPSGPPDAAKPTKAIFLHLEVIRGVAAVLVLMHHVRVLLFPYFDQFPVELQGPLIKGVIFVCGFNRPSVLVFFGLSGFLIIRSVLRGPASFQLRRYAADRLSRLWVVLIPSLLATAGWVFLGRALWGDYAGGIGYLVPADKISISLLQFVGNAAFLQTIHVSFYGDNGPLWSLSYEFWYYVLFPLAVFGFSGPRLQRLVCSTLLMVLLIWLWSGNAEILALLPCWLVGGLAVVAEKWAPATGKRWSFALLSVGALQLGGIFVAHRVLRAEGFWMDYLLGVSVAIYLGTAVVANDVVLGVAYERVARFLSQISYSLYLFHNSFLGFLFYLVLGGEKVMPTAANLLVAILFALTAFAYCVGAWWLFERNNLLVRACFRRLFRVPPMVGAA